MVFTACLVTSTSPILSKQLYGFRYNTGVQLSFFSYEAFYGLWKYKLPFFFLGVTIVMLSAPSFSSRNQTFIFVLDSLLVFDYLGWEERIIGVCFALN